MKQFLKTLTLIFAPGALIGCANTPGPITAWEIRSVLNNFAESAESGDVEVIGTWVRDDVYHWGMESGRIHNGRDEFMQALREDTAAGSEFAEQIDPQLVSFRQISDDVVIVDLLFKYEKHRDKEGRFYDEFLEPTVVVFNREDGMWKIASVYAAGNRSDTYQVQ